MLNKRYLSVILSAIVAAILLAGCGAQQTSGAAQEMSAGERVFRSKCRRCHKVNGMGGNKGKDLSKVAAKRDAAWLDQVLLDPKSTSDTAKMKKSKITDEQRADIIEYLQTLK